MKVRRPRSMLFCSFSFSIRAFARLSPGDFQHREWMVRAYGVTLGISVTRPIVGAFFAARRLQPQQFFGTAFWLGFTISLLAAEGWLIRTRPATAFTENSQLQAID